MPIVQRFALLLLLFIAVEIYGLFVVSDLIGALWAFLLVVAGFVGGSALIRGQGLQAQQKIRIDMMSGKPPALAAMEGMVRMLAGILLIVPGFISDAFGLLLLVPPMRQALLQRMLKQMVMPGGRPGSGRGTPPEGPSTIDGEYRRLDDD